MLLPGFFAHHQQQPPMAEVVKSYVTIQELSDESNVEEDELSESEESDLSETASVGHASENAGPDDGDTLSTVSNSDLSDHHRPISDGEMVVKHVEEEEDDTFDTCSEASSFEGTAVIQEEVPQAKPSSILDQPLDEASSSTR